MDSVKSNYKLIPPITVLLIVINVLVYLLMEFQGSTFDIQYMHEHGAMVSTDVFEYGQWYRVVTSMFMHFGHEHLLNNMLMLGILGYQIEKSYGSIKFLITYLISGIVGNLVSGYIDLYASVHAIGAGASGAVFGMFGVLLVMIFKSRKQLGRVSGGRLAILFLLMVFGNMQAGVDWIAHLAGGLTGVVLALALYRIRSADQILNL